MEMASPEKEVQDETTVQRRPRRPRRATLPSVIGPTSDSVVDSGYHEERQSCFTASNAIDPSDIGFAVTSGSNPKRRSRSADAFASVHDPQRPSPVAWRTHRRRSDEIQYWRKSVSHIPTLEHETDHPLEGDNQIAEQIGKPFELAGDAAPMSFLNHGDEEGKGEHSQRLDSDNRDTFDFGMLASTMQQEENIPIEERMVTVEVKLMDLEYAISKLQSSQTASNQAIPQPPDSNVDTAPETSNPLIADRLTGSRQSPISGNKSHVGSSTTSGGSVSTQPTSLSFSSPPQQTNIDDPFVDNKVRPTSNATTVRHVPISPIPSERYYPNSEPRPRSSIGGITIDHFTTLISLIRTEQAARHRLELQITDLQRQVKNLQQQQQQYQSQYPLTHSPNNSSFSRPRGWIGDRREDSCRGYGGARRMPSYDDTTSTEDGFQDVYETPTEYTRGEFEGGVINGVEGEAF